MTQPLTETLPEAAQAAQSADHVERDRAAWNLPRASERTVPASAHRGGLDWDGFRESYYPDSRRHDLKAIAAYGAYKKSLLANARSASGAAGVSEAIATEAVPLGEWEDEGGASRVALAPLGVTPTPSSAGVAPGQAPIRRAAADSASSRVG